MEIEPYSFGWDQEPREDVDDVLQDQSPQRIPNGEPLVSGHVRGFRESGILEGAGPPASPEELSKHRCAGSGVWKLSAGRKRSFPIITVSHVTSDPGVAMTFASAVLA